MYWIYVGFCIAAGFMLFMALFTIWGHWLACQDEHAAQKRQVTANARARAAYFNRIMARGQQQQPQPQPQQAPDAISRRDLMRDVQRRYDEAMLRERNGGRE